MADPISIPWRGIGAYPLQLGAFTVSPDDRFALVSLHGGQPFLRVIEMASGDVVSELKRQTCSVRWIAPDLILCANAPARRVDLEVVRITTGDVVTRWTAPSRNDYRAFVGLETTNDARCGLVHSVMFDGPLRSPGGFSRLEISETADEIRVRPIDVQPRMSGYGRSAQRHTRIEFEPRDGRALVAHQADVTKPHEAAVIDARTGAVSSWVQTRSDLGPRQPLPRWITPAFVMFGDTPHGYDGTRVWLTGVPPGGVVRAAMLPRAREAEDSAQALASLRHGALHRDGRRVYGVHTGSVDGAWRARAWVTDVPDGLRAEPGAAWEHTPEALTWVGDGVLATMPEMRTATPLAFRSTPSDESIVEVARPRDAALAGFVSELSLSPAGKWILLRSENRAAAWAPVEALATTR